MKSILLYDLYSVESKIRDNELNECWNWNSRINFSSIFIYGDKYTSLSIESSAVHTGDPTRLTFGKFLSIVDYNRGTDGVAILTNSDIKLDPLLIEVTHGLPVGVLLAISRYEMTGMIASNPWCTQDTWVLRLQPIHKPLMTTASFSLGSPGCELRFAELMHSAGFSVYNPCLSFRNIHLHKQASIHKVEDTHFGAYIFSHPCEYSDVIACDPAKSGKVVYYRKGYS